MVAVCSPYKASTQPARTALVRPLMLKVTHIPPFPHHVRSDAGSDSECGDGFLCTFDQGIEAYGCASALNASDVVCCSQGQEAAGCSTHPQGAQLPFCPSNGATGTGCVRNERIATASPCTTRASCSDHGDCVNQQCRCDPNTGWYGETCEKSSGAKGICTDTRCANCMHIIPLSGTLYRQGPGRSTMYESIV